MASRGPGPVHGRQPDAGVRPRDGVQIAADTEPLFAPGTALSYSNTNYLLLVMIVEAATGNSFESELVARIIEPLGLDQTS